MPRGVAGRFYASPSNAKFAAAMEAEGWRASAKPVEAQVLWYQKKTHIPWSELACWHRPNHLRKERSIGHKGELLDALRGARYLPESYALWHPSERQRFVEIARAMPPSLTPTWVLKQPAVDGGKGVEIIRDARAIATSGGVDPKHRQKIAQRYVQGLLLLDGHKFDLRVYWLVASLRPPLVLFHDGTLRVSLARFNATNHTRGQHLTNAAQQEGGHDKARSHEASRQPMNALWNLLERLHPQHPEWPPDPRAIVECQIREAISHIWTTYEPRFTDALRQANREDDAFSLLGADFMIDDNLRLYLSEVQSGPGLPTNTEAVRAIMTAMIPSVAALVVHVHSPRDRKRRRVWPLPQTGFDVIVNGSTTLRSSWCERRR